MTTHVWTVTNDGSVDATAILLFTFSPAIEDTPVFDAAAAPAAQVLASGQDSNGAWYSYVAVAVSAASSASVAWTYTVSPCDVFGCTGHPATVPVGESISVAPTVAGQLTASEWTAIAGESNSAKLAAGIADGMGDYTSAIGDIEQLTSAQQATYLGDVNPTTAQVIGTFARSLAEGQTLNYEAKQNDLISTPAPAPQSDTMAPPSSAGPSGQSAAESLANFTLGSSLAGDNDYMGASFGALENAAAGSGTTTSYQTGTAPPVAVGGAVSFGGGETADVGDASVSGSGTNSTWSVGSVWNDSTSGSGLDQWLGGLSGDVTLNSPSGKVQAAGFPYLEATSQGTLVASDMAFSPIGATGFVKPSTSDARRDDPNDPNSNDFLTVTNGLGQTTESGTSSTLGSTQLQQNLQATAGLTKDAAGAFTAQDPGIGSIWDIYKFFHNAHKIVTSEDPNEITAIPAGTGTSDWIQSQPITYRVDFYNKPTASAPAYNIEVKLHLSPNLDPNSVQPGASSFPGTEFSFDPATGTVTWTLPSIDLPPDSSPPNGEAWVSFSASPKSGLATGTAIGESAQVFFDYNPPIRTATTTQTIDATAPTLSPTATSAGVGKVDLKWTTSGPVPLGLSQIHASIDGSAYGVVGQSQSSSYPFAAKGGHTYAFAVQSTDVAGLISLLTPAGSGALLVGCAAMHSKTQICDAVKSKKWLTGRTIPGQTAKGIAVGLQGNSKHADNFVIRDQVCPAGAPKKAVCFAFTDYSSTTGWQIVKLGEGLFFTGKNPIYLYTSTKPTKLAASSENKPLKLTPDVYMWVP